MLKRRVVPVFAGAAVAIAMALAPVAGQAQAKPDKMVILAGSAGGS